MTIPVTCSNCEAALEAPDDAGGDQFRCPKCNTRLVVPFPHRETASAQRLRTSPDRRERAADPDDYDRRESRSSRRRDDEDDRRPSRRRERRNDSASDQGMGMGFWLGLVSLVLGVVSLAFSAIPCIGFFGLPFSSIALILGLIGCLMACRDGYRGIGLSAGGLGASVLAIGVGCFWGVVTYRAYVEARDAVRAVEQAAEQEQKLRQQQQQQAQAKYAPGRPLAQAWNQNGVAYLCELDEYDARVGWGRMGKRGMLGYGVNPWDLDSEVSVNGRKYPHALSLVPPSFSHSTVKYNLNGKARRLKGWAAMNDPLAANHPPPASAATFEILGDGRELWKSQPIQQEGTAVAFDVDVRGVNVLELRVNCPGAFECVHTVWLEPHVIR